MSTTTKPKPKAKRKLGKVKLPKPKAISIGAIHKAMGHEIRRRILTEITKNESHPTRERLGMSPNQLSKVLPWSLSTVSYHVTILRDCGAIELQSTEQRRGAVEHYYRASAWMRKRQEDSKVLDEIAQIVNDPPLDGLKQIAAVLRGTGREIW